MKFSLKRVTLRQSIDDLILFSRLYPIRSPQMQPVYESVQHPFLKEGMGLLLEGILEEKAFHRILRQRLETYHRKNLQLADQLRLASQVVFFCAFPLMFWFLAKDQYANAGWTLMFTTFFTSGILSGLIFGIKKYSFQQRSVNEAIVHGLHLISTKTNPITVSEELNSFLPPDQRIPWVAAALQASNKKAS